MTRRRVVVGILALLAAPFAIVLVVALFTTLPPELKERAAPSLRVLAKGDKLLREVRADDGTRARPLPIDAYPKRALDAMLAAEDRHFYSHFGVDVMAVIRASASNLVHRRVVSGASTITMQLARTVRPHRRSLWGKIAEAGLAVRIEWSLSKDEILEQYLNRVIYGPSLRGYAAASQAYFGVEPNSLSISQAALLAGLPRGPSLYAITKRPDLALKRRNRVIERMRDAGFIDDSQEETALGEPLVAALDRPALGAPHFVRGLTTGAIAIWQPGLSQALADRSGIDAIHTTINPELQRDAEHAVAVALAEVSDRHVTAASVIVIDNNSGDILAWVGSNGFYDEASLGQNDGVIALRQPGSSLKPFIYAEAMTRLGYTPATILPDVEIHIPLPGGGDYVPHDYDEKQRGPVRLREALGSSLNIPAVDTIRRIGTNNALARLHLFGFDSLDQDAEHYGPALALGDGEVTLVELARAYSGLARGGLTRPLRLVRSIERGGKQTILDGGPDMTGMRVLDERTAAMLADILSDRTARMSAFGDQNVLEIPDAEVAAKTGTSKGYRDNVAVGFTRDVTVAVWAGNFDGSPMQGVSGISGAGPIFRTVMTAAVSGHPRRPLVSADDAARIGLARTSVCATSGEIPTAACPHTIREWLPDDAAEHGAPCSIHVAIRVDRRNGLPAGPGCAREETEERLFEQWPREFTEWAARTNRPVVPIGSSLNCPITADAEVGDAPVQIVYPFDHARFVIDPERPRDLQVLQIKVVPESTELKLDGAALPKSHAWPLTAGEHTITAAGAHPIRITVR